MNIAETVLIEKKSSNGFTGFEFRELSGQSGSNPIYLDAIKLYPYEFENTDRKVIIVDDCKNVFTQVIPYKYDGMIFTYFSWLSFFVSLSHQFSVQS